MQNRASFPDHSEGTGVDCKLKFSFPKTSLQGLTAGL